MFQIGATGAIRWVSCLQALILWGGVAGADTLVSCHDGDTCRIRTASGVINMRLNGVDTPEIDQPMGKQARDYLLSLLKGKELTTTCYGSAKGNRLACSVLADGKDVQWQLAQAGLAWDYPAYSKGKYAKPMAEAKAAGRGLWAAEGYQSPYCWRWAGTPKCEQTNNRYQP